MPVVSHPRKQQQGMALADALLALVFMAVGLLALLASQLRVHTDAQTTAGRAQAIRAIEDLSEKIKANPEGFQTIMRSASFSGLTQWQSDGAVLSKPNPSCDQSVCNPEQIAIWELWRWRTSLGNLPKGNGAIFVRANDARQVGIMVAWRSNETTNAESELTGPIYGTLGSPEATTAPSVTCPPKLICHLVYIHV